MGLLPRKKALVERLADQPFSFVGVFGRNGDPAEIAARLRQEGIDWRNALDLGEPADGVLWSRWAVRGFPQFYLLDARGVIRRRWFGDPGAELEPAIAELLAEARAAK
jgi:hypothetical protein